MKRSSAVAARRAGAVVAAAGCLTACTGGAPDQPPSDGRPAVVASTDVWGSVARAVAGDDARVNSVASATTDPHSFEPSPAAAAAITDADLMVYNGGGYDAWAKAVLDNHPSVASVDAYSLLDAAAVGEPRPANEHVFYELNTAKAVAERIAQRLSDADPPHADGYRSRAAEFGRTADTILGRQQILRSEFPGAAVVATEPVAHYLLLAAGLTDRTPRGFTAAIEQDTDPAPVDIAAMLDLISKRGVAVLLFNEQTATGATRQLRDAARSAGLPVVAVTETLPPGTDYLAWQAGTVDRLTEALRLGR